MQAGPVVTARSKDMMPKMSSAAACVRASGRHEEEASPYGHVQARKRGPNGRRIDIYALGGRLTLEVHKYAVHTVPAVEGN